MSRHRSSRVWALMSAMLVCTLGLISSAGIRVASCAQQAAAATGGGGDDDTARAIKLYTQGDLTGAIEALRGLIKLHKENADAWLYFGLALNRVGQIKEARKAFEQAVKLSPNSSVAHTGWAYTLLLTDKKREALREAGRALELNDNDAVAHYIVGVVRLKETELSDALRKADDALRIDSKFWPALLLRAQAVIGLYVAEAYPSEQSKGSDKATSQPLKRPLLREAVESLEKYLQFNGRASDAKLWREQLEALRPYAEYTDKPVSERTTFSPREVTTKARLLSRPEPMYTAKAREAGIQGTVVLRAILAADGTVRNILLLRHLNHGLSEEAIRVARQIKFIPATMNGRPVSQFIQIEYNFSLY